MKVFFSYSHKDEPFRDELEIHLSPLKRSRLISTWHDRKIGAGDEWAGQIDDRLQEADLILLLVSAHFIASDYCYDLEMKAAMERHEKREARVIPIILSPVDWQKAPFAKLQAVPRDGKPVTQAPSRDQAWLEVVQAIRQVVERG